MLRKQAEFKELIEQGKFIEEYVGKEVLKEGSPIIILEGYEWIREVLSLLAKNINLFESCLVLLENNMEQEAYILARSQFNNTLWISYLCDDYNNERTKEYYYEYHISKLLQFRNIQKYVSENEEKIKNSGAEIIEESEIEEKITQVEALLTSEGYNTEKIYTKSIAKLAKEKQELFGVYISMYCEGSEYEHSNRGKVASFREAILDEYDTDNVFKIELGKSDLTTWKQVFNFALLNVFYGRDALHSRIESRDKHLFDAGMISEPAMARTLYMIKELNDKLDAYGVEPS